MREYFYCHLRFLSSWRALGKIRYMNKKGRIALRNHFVKFLNDHPKFDCKAHSGLAPAPKKRVNAKERHFWRFVCGTAKDGRTILIYPMILRNERVPIFVAKYMSEIADKSPYVGCATDLGDVYCIIANDPIEYPRADKTNSFRYWIKKYQESKNGSTTKEPSST